MDACIIVDTESEAARISGLLGNEGFGLSSIRVLRTNDVCEDAAPIAGTSGIVFIGASQLEHTHFDLLRGLRSTISHAAKLVLITPEPDHGTVLKAVRAGASDVLDAGECLGEEIANFISRASLEFRQNDTSGRVVTIVPCHAPSDACILASNLAVVVAAHSKHCGLIDFHFRGGEMSILLKLEPRHTVLDLLNQTESIDEAMFKQALSLHKSGVELLAGPMSFGAIKDIESHKCQQIINLSKQLFPFVVINAEDVQHAEQVRAIAVSDAIILTMRLDVASLYRTQRHVEYLVQCNVPRDHIHIVAMGTGYSGELPLDSVSQVLHTPNMHRIPDDPIASVMSVNIGNPLVLESPKSKASIAITILTESIMGLSGNKSQTVGRRSAFCVTDAAVNTLHKLCSAVGTTSSLIPKGRSHA